MDHRKREGSGQARFAAYVERLAGVLGHADRAAPLKAYCTGLILPGTRKSIEPIAARVEPGALPPCGSARPIAITCGMSPDPRSGSWSSGLRAKGSRQSTGWRPCRPTRH